MFSRSRYAFPVLLSFFYHQLWLFQCRSQTSCRAGLAGEENSNWLQWYSKSANED